MSSAKLFCQFFCSVLLFASMANISYATIKDNKTASVKGTIEQGYQHIIDAYASLDATTMASAYTSDGYYISTGKNNTIVHGTSQLNALYQRYFDKIKKNNYKLAIQFRVIDRLKDTKSITDVGYYLVSVIPPPENNQPLKQHAGKFLITFRQSDDKQWRIWSDANNRVTINEYHNAKKVGDLFYSLYRPLHDIGSENSSPNPALPGKNHLMLSKNQ